MSSETAGACLPYSLSRCFAILGKRGGSIPIFLCCRKNEEEEENKKFPLLPCDKAVSGLVSPGSRALAQHAPVREWRRRNRAERHVDRRARKSVER
jgi:hypothetical protein